MKLTNRHGTPVDPVPFFVVASLAFLVNFSYGPFYCLALGLSISWGFVVSGMVFLLATSISYHQLVWTVRPELRGEIPANQRL